MKKTFQNYLFISLMVVLVAGFIPLSSASYPATNQQNPEITLQSLPVIDALPIETTLNPLTDISDTSFRNGEKAIQSDIIAEDNTIVKFNIGTRDYEVVEKKNPDEFKIDPTLFQPYEGKVDEDLLNAWEAYNSDMGEYAIRPTWVFGPDDRTLVTDTEVFPYSSVVSIHVDGDSGSYIGSGAMIDETHVLTVAHIAYIHDDGGLVNSMEVVPGRDGSSRPFGTASGVEVRLPSEWINSESAQHDWAVVTLSTDMGSSTGWMGIATFEDDDPIYDGTFYTAGYPGDLDPTGRTMYNTSDVGKGADYYNHWFALDTSGGQSGSGIWFQNASGRYITTILAYEYEDGVFWNFGTRINDDLYAQIATFLMIDADTDPNVELRSTGPPGTTASAWEQFYKQSTVLGIGAEVGNIGGVAATNIKVGFYLSLDNEVTTEDYLIGTETISELGIMDTEFVEWYGTVPKEVPNARYYMGWVIDPDNTIEEYNENDNGGTVGTLQIIVTSTAFQEFMWSPTGRWIMIGAGVGLVLIITISITVGVKKRRKRRAASANYNNYYQGDYQDPPY